MQSGVLPPVSSGQLLPLPLHKQLSCIPAFWSTCFLELALEAQSIMSPQWQADQYVSTQTPRTCCYDNVGGDRVTAQWAEDRTWAVKRADEKHESLLEWLCFPLNLFLSLPVFCMWVKCNIYKKHTDSKISMHCIYMDIPEFTTQQFKSTWNQNGLFTF